MTEKRFWRTASLLRTAPWWVAALVLFSGFTSAEPEKPNILFIALDDLNDWVGCLGGHPQARTPNLDRLAASGVLFTNAHCPGAACNPSRTAIMTGLSPHHSGLYVNEQKMREVLPDAEILPQYLRNHGYHAMGSGKILHYFIDAPSWDEYFPAKESENPFPRTLYPEKRPVSLPRGGPWQYVETDWAALDATDEEYGGDWLVSKWVGEQLGKIHEAPFFLACGIYRPHEPWFVPKKYFEPFPLEEIQLPPGYKEEDLEDLPPAGKNMGPNRYFAHIRKHGQWKQGIQGYLASIHFADAMLGRVLDALEKGPHAKNTILVLWSDHGWHLGEKQHWQKFTAWRAVTRVPLMIRVPENCATGLPGGTTPGSVCDRPVNLLSLFPTLTDLAGVPRKADNDGPSLLPLLKNPEAAWPRVSLTHLGKPGSYGLSAQDWRYIHYSNGDEELYRIKDDPHEWDNLAGDSAHAAKLAELRALAPETFVPLADCKAIIPGSPQTAPRRITAPPDDLKLDPFYHQYLSVGGYPVVSSDRVSPYALLEAAYIVEKMLAKRPDVLRALVETKSRLCVMAHDEFTTDIPEHARLGSEKGGHSANWWDRRARGLGGSATDPVASCAEENLLCFPGDPYARENILIHEFAHTIHLRGLNHLDPGFDARLQKTFDQSIASGLWKGTYAATNHHEYWAEGVQSWFNNNRENDHDHNHVNTREELASYDPALARILEEVFGDTRFDYVRPPERKSQDHLEGYDYSQSPTFRWPNHLKILDLSK